MIKVYQTKIGKNGNCFNACLASILEVDIKILPETKFTGNWLTAYQKFLKPYNLGINWVNPIGSNEKFNGYAIADKQRVDGKGGHGVVYLNARKKHDPFPKDMSGAKLGKVITWYVITVLDPTKPIKLLNEHQK